MMCVIQSSYFEISWRTRFTGNLVGLQSSSTRQISK